MLTLDTSIPTVNDMDLPIARHKGIRSCAQYSILFLFLIIICHYPIVLLSPICPMCVFPGVSRRHLEVEGKNAKRDESP
jgi:hypothetical protein